jgi:hypothetical protein
MFIVCCGSRYIIISQAAHTTKRASQNLIEAKKMTVTFSKEYTTGANINALATSNEEYITEADQYASGPFDQLTVTNKGSVELRVNLDNSSTRVLSVPPGYFSFRDLRFLTFSVTNVSATGTHTAGTVKFLVENTHFPRRS